MLQIVACLIALITNLNIAIAEPTPVSTAPEPTTPVVKEVEVTTEKQEETEIIPCKEVTTEITSNETELTLEEQYEQQGYKIVYERPQNKNEIYCRPGMTLEEWWEINPPNDGYYDDWDDENNSPDII